MLDIAGDTTVRAVWNRTENCLGPAQSRPLIIQQPLCFLHWLSGANTEPVFHQTGTSALETASPASDTCRLTDPTKTVNLQISHNQYGVHQILMASSLSEVSARSFQPLQHHTNGIPALDEHDQALVLLPGSCLSKRCYSSTADYLICPNRDAIEVIAINEIDAQMVKSS